MIPPRRSIAELPHYVYRHYDADGRVLYIGCTSDPDKRFGAQRTAQVSAHWWPLVARTEVIGPMPYPEALHAETWAIRADLPPYNQYVPRPYTLEQIRFLVRTRRSIPPARQEAS